MQTQDIEDAAMFLLHLRTQRDQVSGLPGEFAPKTIEQAYDIQDATHRFAGWPIQVLKVGCTSEAAQQALDVPHPIGGRIPAEGVFADASTIPRSFFGNEPMLECEIAVRIDEAGTIDAVAPAIEVVNGRFTGLAHGRNIIADNSAGCAVVIGAAVNLATAGDLDTITMALSDSSGEIAQGSAAALMGGAQASVDWVLEHEAARGRTVEPGTWIITGTCTGLTPTAFGETYTAHFSTIGQVSLNLGASESA